MAEIVKPATDFDDATTVAKFLIAIANWEKKYGIPKHGFHSHAWFRGHSKRSYELHPGVYRDDFTKRAQKWVGSSLENKRLNLEREMLSEFRVAGATLLNANEIVPLYFIAQHNGMPTRLLDWTSNPLASLFFAVNSSPTEDGEVLIMEPRKVIPKPKNKRDPLDHVRTMRHPYVVDAIGMSYWHKPRASLDHDFRSLILPVRPDNTAGRIGQQSSCFTLHMHEAKPQDNPTLVKVKVPAGAKGDIREELRLLNINAFSIYNDLDSLSSEIKGKWL